MLVDIGDEGKVSHGLHRLSRIFFLFHLPLNMTKAVFLSLFIVVIYSCSPSKKLDAETMATNACDCFNQLTEGTIDERLTPCFSQPISENSSLIEKAVQMGNNGYALFGELIKRRKMEEQAK